MYTWVVCVCAPSQRRNSKFIQNGQLKPVNFMQATKTCIDADHQAIYKPHVELQFVCTFDAVSSLYVYMYVSECIANFY